MFFFLNESSLPIFFPISTTQGLGGFLSTSTGVRTRPNSIIGKGATQKASSLEQCHVFIEK